MSWADICKVTGHRSIDTLIKSYDLNLEGEGLANAAMAIGSGPDVAQGSAFKPVRLEKRKAIAEHSKAVKKIVPAAELPESRFDLDLPEVEAGQYLATTPTKTDENSTLVNLPTLLNSSPGDQSKSTAVTGIGQKQLGSGTGQQQLSSGFGQQQALYGISQEQLGSGNVQKQQGFPQQQIFPEMTCHQPSGTGVPHLNQFFPQQQNFFDPYQTLRNGLGQQQFLGTSMGQQQFLRTGMGQQQFMGTGMGQLQFMGTGLGQQQFMGTGPQFTGTSMGQQHFMGTGMGQQNQVPMPNHVSGIGFQQQQYPGAVLSPQQQIFGGGIGPMNPQLPVMIGHVGQQHQQGPLEQQQYIGCISGLQQQVNNPRVAEKESEDNKDATLQLRFKKEGENVWSISRNIGK